MGSRIRLRFRGKSIVTRLSKSQTFPYKKYEYIIRNLAYRFGYLPGIDIEDLVQLAYLKLYKVMSQFDPSLSSEKTWVVTVVRRTFVDIYRRVIADLPKTPNGREPIFNVSLDEILENDSFQFEDNSGSAEDMLIVDGIVKEIKDLLDPFEQLVLDCKLCPEKIYDNHQKHNRNLCQRAIAEYKKLSSKKLAVRITEATVARHLSCLLDMKITKGEVHYAIRKIKDATLQVVMA